MIKKSLFLVFCLITFLVQTTLASVEASPSSDPPITVGEYITFLKAVAVNSDVHHLYDDAVSSQIIRYDDRTHFYYSIADRVNEDELLYGLTDLDAMRYCNWIEAGCLIGDEGVNSTESGVYCLFGDDLLFDHWLTSHHYLIEKNTKNGIVFIIATRAEDSKTS